MGIFTSIKLPRSILQLILKKYFIDKLKINIKEYERKNIRFKSLIRTLSSKIAICLGNLFLILRGKKAYSDPVTGFFGMNKSIISKIDEKRIIKKGWKFSYDVLKQIPAENVESIYFENLGKRKAGDSKFNPKAVLYYLFSLIT